jgi:uncharacterized protein
MNKIIITITTIIVLVLIGFILFALFGKYIQDQQPAAIVNNNKIKLLIAKSQKDKELGLSIYKTLPNNQGMIFSFGKKDYYSFWMKNMKFPIDIIYLNNKKIVTIFKNVPTSKDLNPPIYKPTSPADTVLEINAGVSKKYNLKIGDSITYENFSG